MDKKTPDALTRSWSHLDPYQFGKNIFGTFFAYSVLIHPIHIALAYKRLDYSHLSTVDCFKLIKKNHGYRGLYRGFGITCTGMICDEILFMPTLEYIKENGLSGVNFESQIAKDGFAGLIGYGLLLPIYTPFSVLSNKQMTAGLKDTYGYQNISSLTKTIIKNEGISGLFKGTAISILYLPFHAVWWSIYRINKNWLYGLNLTSKDSIAINGFAGGLTATSMTLITNPIDVMTTKIQALNKGEKKMILLTKSIFRQYGIRGFYKGVGLNLCQKFFEGGFYGIMYDAIKQCSEKNTS